MRPAPANLCHRPLPDGPSPCLLTSQVHQDISYAAIAALARNRGSALATVAALIGGIGAFCGAIINVFVFPGLAAAATAHTTRAAAAQFLVTTSNSEFSQVFQYVYFIGIYVAPLLPWACGSGRRYVAIQPATRRTDRRPRTARSKAARRDTAPHAAASTAARSEQKAGQGGAGLAHPRVPGRENLEETHEARPRLVPLLP